MSLMLQSFFSLESKSAKQQEHKQKRIPAAKHRAQQEEQGSEMDSIKPLIYQPQPLIKKLMPWTLSALLPVALLRLYFYPQPLFLPTSNPLHNDTNVIIFNGSSSLSPHSQERAVSNGDTACDYSNGKWIHDELGPLYNGTACGSIIKQRENCVNNGRPDRDYLYWRWKPEHCVLPRFEPEKFLQFIRNKHLAFIGDSIARNQMESLLCMMATISPPNLVYSNGEDNRFRKWHFPSHNVSVSGFWSPFLVRGKEKSHDYDPKRNYNTMYLDSVDEKWAEEINHLDMIVLSVGQWFLQCAVYFDGDSVLGCHLCSQNYTEIGFYDAYGKAHKAALNAIIDRKGPSSNGIDVIVSTLAPQHYEGDWDKGGKCPKTQPYNASEKKLEGVAAEMRNIAVQEIEAAKVRANKFGKLRFQAVDVSTLSLLRPDGHPGLYFYPNPNTADPHHHHDCLHWCLPGPIDTWNEILLEVIKR